VKLEPDETVVLAWIVYESREHRDRVNEQVMNDPRIAIWIPKPCRSTPNACSGGLPCSSICEPERGSRHGRLTASFGTAQPKGGQSARLTRGRRPPRIGDLRAARALLDQLA
jgi:Protein of unknown function (DUF1428)